MLHHQDAAAAATREAGSSGAGPGERDASPRIERQIVRALRLLGPLSWSQLADAQDGTLREFHRALAHLAADGQVTVGGGHVSVALAPESARSAGLDRLGDLGCVACDGRGFRLPSGAPLLARLEGLLARRPSPAPAFDQSFMVTADALLRAAFAQARGDLDGRRILVIGDDGLQTLSLALAGRPERVVMLDIDERLAAFVRDVAGLEGLPVEACAYDVRTPLPARFAGGFDVVVCDPLETVAGLRLFLARAAAALCGAGTAIIFGLTTLEACAAKWHAVQRLLHDMGFFITDARRRFHGYPGHDGPPDDPRFNLPFLEAFGQTGAEAGWYRSALVRAEAVRSPDPCVVDPVRPDLELCVDEEAWATPRGAPETGATPDRSALTFPAPDLAADALERCVAAALERQAPPSLAALVRPARLFDEGWNFRVLALGGEWVVRVPRTAESRPLLHRERALLDVVRAAVDASGVAIPEVAFIGEPAEGLPGGFTLCRRVPGVAAWRLPAERLDRPAVARQLARFLTALHGVPLSRIAAFGIPVDPDMVSLAANGARVARIVAPAQLDQALEDAGISGAARRRCAEILAEPDRWRAAGEVSPCLIHGDFEVDHILLDPDGACVRGVIDWTDSVLGDPAADLAGLWVWGGSPLVDAVLADHGGAPADPGLRDRVRGYGRLNLVRSCHDTFVAGDRELFDFYCARLEELHATGEA